MQEHLRETLILTWFVTALLCGINASDIYSVFFVVLKGEYKKKCPSNL